VVSPALISVADGLHGDGRFRKRNARRVNGISDTLDCFVHGFAALLDGFLSGGLDLPTGILSIRARPAMSVDRAIA